MIDKSLVKRRFKKSLETYTDNAVVQKQMAEKLISLLGVKQYDKVFEIGCSSGVLTNFIAGNIKYNKIWINDIVSESKKYIDNILLDYTFLAGDIETIDLTEKYNLIISNACLQWCNNLEKIIKKLYSSLQNGGTLAISIFGNSNLKELKSIFDIEEHAYSKQELKHILSEYKQCSITEDNVELYFNNLREILQHLKNTGANSLREYKLTRTSLKNFEERYAKNYQKNGKVVLTYNPVYIIINK